MPKQREILLMQYFSGLSMKEMLLKRYKEGKLTEELAKKVEEEIEKQEAISDYLVDQMEQEWESEDVIAPKTGQDSGKSEDKSEDITKLINQAIHRAFVKMGVIVLALSIAVILFVSFGLSPLVSSFYYNPGETVVKDSYGNNMNQMSVDFGVYSELTMPGKHRENVIVSSRGYGKYDIQCVQNLLSSGYTSENMGGQIEKGKLIWYDSNTFAKVAVNVFAGYNLPGSGTISEKQTDEATHWIYVSKEEGTKALQELDEDQAYSGCKDEG